MDPAVAGEHSDLRPADEQRIIGGPAEPTNILAPELKPAQSEGEPTLQLWDNVEGIRAVISSPMQGITLTPRPGTACPDDAVTCCFLGHIEDGLVIEQRVEIVHLTAGRPVVINAINRRRFAEVGFDDFDTHLK